MRSSFRKQSRDGSVEGIELAPLPIPAQNIRRSTTTESPAELGDKSSLYRGANMDDFIVMFLRYISM